MSFSLCDYFLVNDKERQSIFSRSTIRKMFSLLNSQYIDGKGHLKLLKAIRSLGEHMCIDFILHHQDSKGLTKNLRSAIGLKNDQLLEPGLIFFSKLFFFILIIVY